MAITQKRTPNYLEAPLLLFILNLFLFSSLFPFSVFLPLLSFWIQFSSDNIWSDTTWECLRAAVLLNKPISHPFLLLWELLWEADPNSLCFISVWLPEVICVPGFPKMHPYISSADSCNPLFWPDYNRSTSCSQCCSLFTSTPPLKKKKPA